VIGDYSRFLVPLGAGASGGLVHQALIYANEDEFIASTVPFIAHGLDADERVLAVTTPPNCELLRRALGASLDSPSW
jgi:hypothetical protein